MIKKDKNLGYKSSDLIQEIILKNQSYHDSLKYRRIDPSTLGSIVSLLFTISGNVFDKSSLEVLEIGGGAGHLAMTFNTLFPEVKLNWTNVETPELIAHSLAANVSPLGFKNITWDELRDLKWPNLDIVIANSSLQYLDNPISSIMELLSISDSKFFYVGKTPFSSIRKFHEGALQFSRISSNGPRSESNKSQTPKRKSQQISYPINAIDRDEFLKLFRAWSIDFEFEEGSIDFHLRCSFFANFLDHRYCKSKKIANKSILLSRTLGRT